MPPRFRQWISRRSKGGMAACGFLAMGVTSGLTTTYEKNIYLPTLTYS
jgi:hypothetical protein